jgi:hypothetical protein
VVNYFRVRNHCTAHQFVQYSHVMTVTIERTEPVASTRKTPVTTLSLPTVVRDQANDIAIDQTTRTRRKVSMAAVIGAALALAVEQPDAFAEILDRPEPTGGETE